MSSSSIVSLRMILPPCCFLYVQKFVQVSLIIVYNTIIIYYSYSTYCYCSPINVNLQTRETRLLQYTFPNEGLTLTTDLTQGQIQIYGSFSIHNPTALTADFAVRSSHLFISTELYMSTINSSRISKHQSLLIVHACYTLLLTALQSNTAFSMNTTFGDTTPPPRG